MYFAIYAIIVFAGLAMTVREGLWSNTLTLFNVAISGLLAYGFYAPLTIGLDNQTEGSYTYVLDFVVVWVLFVIAILILRATTRAASKTRMRFRHPIDPVGGPIIGFLAAWVLAAFMMSTLHMAPMPKDAFGGKLVYTTADVAAKSPLTSPDLGWLRFVERVSGAGAYGSGSTNRFSATGFIAAYMGHREALGKTHEGTLTVKRR